MEYFEIHKNFKDFSEDIFLKPNIYNDLSDNNNVRRERKALMSYWLLFIMNGMYFFYE